MAAAGTTSISGTTSSTPLRREQAGDAFSRSRHPRRPTTDIANLWFDDWRDF
jgi:hypothetical protein